MTYLEFVDAVQSRATEKDHVEVQDFIDKQIWGTPEQCLEKVRALKRLRRERTSPSRCSTAT